MHQSVQPPQMYNVGDFVTIKEHPVECAFIWIREMNEYCGREAVIEGARFSIDKGCWRYEINIDQRKWGWCENCFVPRILDLPEIDMSDVDVLTLFS